MARIPLPTSLTRQRRELTKLWLRFRVPIVAGVTGLVVVVAGWYAWDAWQRNAEESRQRLVQVSARSVTEEVGKAVSGILGSVDAALGQATLAKLLAAGDAVALREQEAALVEAVPGALGVRVIQSDLREPNYDAVPPITYASLEMMRQAGASGEAPEPEVLLAGEKEQHVAVLRPVVGADGAVAGFVLFGLDVDLLAKAVARADMPSGYVELVQGGGKGGAVVATKGHPGYKSGVPITSLPVQGTRLRVLYWAETSVAAQPSADVGLPLVPTAGAALVLLAAGAALVVLRRRRATGRTAARAQTEKAREAPAKDAAVDEALGLTDEPTSLGEGEGGIEVVEGGVPVAPAAGGVVSDAIFRAYDVRGIVGESLTVEVVKQLGLAIGSEAYDRGQQTVCVGCDGRASSPELVAALTEGLRESGRDVIDVGRVPTPVLYFATYYLETGSGVMVTGSHNPPEYNGLKIMLGGDTLFGDDIQGLRKRIEAGEFASGAGNLQNMDISADYIRRVSEDVPVALGNAFKVVIDCGNGVAGDFAPKLIRALGHDVVELYCNVDGNFPNHHPDPSQPENLVDLIEAVKDNDADLGFAFDGDGDRLGVVDASGRIVWPDSQMMLYARDVLSRNKGAEIVFDVKCSSRLGKVIAKLGGKPVMFKTGHSFIKNKLKETGAPLAGEMSGHIFFKERWYGFDDALYTSARMLEILMGFKQKPAEVFAKLPTGVSTPELRVDMGEGENIAFVESLKDAQQFPDARITTIDGVRVDWKDGWGLVRASNTTPSLVLRFEGDDEKALERVKETFRGLLLEKRPDLSLPF